MRRLVVGLLALASLPVWAGDAWNDKAPNAWTESDIKKILNSSPWAKTITVPATWLRTGAQGPEVGTGITIASGRKIETEGPAERDSDAHDKLYDQNARFGLRWASARAVRAAELRAKVLAGNLSQAQADRELEREPDDYELLLIGDALAPFPITNEVHLETNTLLRLGKNGREMHPRRVRINRRTDGQILSVRFCFARVGRDGEAFITPQTRQVDFECFVGTQLLRAKFEPPKMISRAGNSL
jgi:hypothetical protein